MIRLLLSEALVAIPVDAVKIFEMLDIRLPLGRARFTS